MPPQGGGNIKVVVRCRPFNGRELDRGATCIVQMEGAQTVLVPPPDAEERMRSGKGGGKDVGQKVFAFDKSYWSFDKSDPNYAGQDDLHEDLGKPLLDNAFQGYNNCIFAYGQTGSGKSYSMMGYGKEAGVVPKICQDMFERISQMQSKDKNVKFTVEVSYLEIYNERVRDLLNPSTKGNLKVREHPSTGPYVEDLAKLVAGSFNEIEHLMDEGNKARTVAATNMNETSSRSHAVFTLTLTQKRYDTDTKMSLEKVAKISLVDLAGSERAQSTGATGARLKEGAEINRSLSTLGRVIAALADLSEGKKKKGGKSMGQVPYRDSVLTWLLKDSLGGNSMTAMIAAISPADINFDETLSTLRYADSAKRIKNHAVVNEDANARMIRELKEELEALRGKLSGGGGGGTEEVYAEGTPLDKQIVSIVQADGSVKKVSKAEIAEQLNQSEKLYSDLNQTWEQKLQKTEEIHKEREAALEELGISIEKGFVGLHTPKKMPHLVNLSDDPLLAECLVYNLKPGTTTVGNVDTVGEHVSEIRLNGTRILDEHCTFENADNAVTLVPSPGAAVMVNGKRIEEPKRLRSGYRVILGDFHIFRFNHPMEARAERAEQSSLRHSIIANQMGDFEKVSPSPSPRPGHERSYSKAMSEADWDGTRPDSPMSSQRGRDSDWSFARREAASAILGPDKQIAGLTDEELNILFEDVQKARAERAGQNMDDDLDSVTSYPIREKYLSNGTLDNFSLDTALTMPSTPKQGEVEDKMREVREEMQIQLDRQKEEYLDQLKTAEASNVEVEEIRKEKSRMEESLREVKEDMLKQLQAQRKEFEERLQSMAPRSVEGPTPLTEREIRIAEKVVEHWKGRRYVRIAEAVLQSAANLKEAQIMSQEMDESVVFQFTIVDVGHDLCSSYDMVLNGISGEGDDLFLEDATKPCVGVRVIDYRNSVVHLWSLEKLRDRVKSMRQMHQYMDRPEYLKHFQLDNPFMETCMPQYTHVGDVDVPLAAVFESRVQDFSLDVLSPYTSHAIGMIKLSLEPSSARAPSSTLKFNVVMHDFIGFAEREGTEVHAQLFLPGISAEGGVTTTQMIKDFDEGPIRFESVHSMSVPMFGPTNVCLRVAIFAKVSSMHLDKLLSWDDMRDNVVRPKQKRKNARIAESQFHTEEKHDLFARIQIHELAENGEYLPVEVLQTSDLDKGSFQLHQGLQRRIVINLTHSSGDALPWDDVSGLRVGRVQLVDHVGKTPDLRSSSPEIPLKLVVKPRVQQNANGTSNVTIIGQWDSSAHESLLLDRVTPDKYKVQISLAWDVSSPKLADLMIFSIDVCGQILSRSYVRSTSMFASLWQTVRVVHSTSGIFSVALRPTPVKRAGDLWRMNTQNDFVKGEEGLTSWTPRGVSLIRDYIAAKRRKQRHAEIEAAQPIFSRITFPAISAPPTSNGDTPPVEEETLEPTISEDGKKVLEKYIKLWKLCQDPITNILTPTNVEPPTNGAPPTQAAPPTSPSLLASITQVPKNPTVLKGGYLLTPSTDSSRWVRRFIELRRPYMHIHSVPDGEEVSIVSLRNSRVDHQPQIARLLRRDGGAVNARGRAQANDEDRVFAIYGTDNTWLFKARSEREKVEWIFKIDQSYFGASGSGSGDGTEDDDYY
ncbi:probable kinesin-II subunit [Rhynchosporium secalis]|uniref:Probable kinesin-II subunit n=1 Tax=Rhynchosporium secalis TaxID=38038 RepID=A0A1E1LWF2_RHYSE|nr:probable kinesin-II subunit [Rhynchosporium secalis]